LPLYLQVEEPLYFVDFLREPVLDEETGETIDAHPSFYESVPGGLKEVKQRIEALQRKFNEESKVRHGCWAEMLKLTLALHGHAHQPARWLHYTDGWEGPGVGPSTTLPSVIF
jgi:hypothetical protein